MRAPSTTAGCVPHNGRPPACVPHNGRPPVCPHNGRPPACVPHNGRPPACVPHNGPRQPSWLDEPQPPRWRLPLRRRTTVRGGCLKCEQRAGHRCPGVAYSRRSSSCRYACCATSAKRTPGHTMTRTQPLVVLAARRIRRAGGTSALDIGCGAGLVKRLARPSRRRPAHR